MVKNAEQEIEEIRLNPLEGKKHTHTHTQKKTLLANTENTERDFETAIHSQNV